MFFLRIFRHFRNKPLVTQQQQPVGCAVECPDQHPSRAEGVTCLLCEVFQTTLSCPFIGHRPRPAFPDCPIAHRPRSVSERRHVGAILKDAPRVGHLLGLQAAPIRDAANNSQHNHAHSPLQTPEERPCLRESPCRHNLRDEGRRCLVLLDHPRMLLATSE